MNCSSLSPADCIVGPSQTQCWLDSCLQRCRPSSERDNGTNPCSSTVRASSASNGTPLSITADEVEFDYVEVRLIIQNVDYSRLTRNSSLLQDFETRVKLAIENHFGPGVTANGIALELSTGSGFLDVHSVIVDADIMTPQADQAEAVLIELREASQLPDMVATQIGSIEGIEAISTGPIIVEKGAVNARASSEAHSSEISTSTAPHQTHSFEPDMSNVASMSKVSIFFPWCAIAVLVLG